MSDSANPTQQTICDGHKQQYFYSGYEAGKKDASEAWTPTVREGESLSDVPLEQWIGEAIGAASSCWVGGTGALEFDSARASEVAAALTTHVRGLLEEFVRESERRRKLSDGYLANQLRQAKDAFVAQDKELAAAKRKALYYDEDTLMKVRAGLRTVLGSEQVITDAITGMQNEGVLFREEPR